MPKYMGRTQFEQMKVLKRRKSSNKAIAKALGMSPATVSRNLRYNSYEDYLVSMYGRASKSQKEVEAKSGPVAVTKKVCSKCGETKPLEEFDKDKNGKNGIKSFCKECRREAQRKYAKARRLAKKMAKKPEVVRNEHIAVYQTAPSCPGWSICPEPRVEEKKDDDDTYSIGERVYVYIGNKVKKGIIVAVNDEGYSADYIVSLDGLFCHKNVKVGSSNVFRGIQ